MLPLLIVGGVISGIMSAVKGGSWLSADQDQRRQGSRIGRRQGWADAADRYPGIGICRDVGGTRCRAKHAGEQFNRRHRDPCNRHRHGPRGHRRRR